MSGQAAIDVIRAENYRFLQRHIYTEVGIVIEEDKHYLIESRLAPIVQTNWASAPINDLCALHQRHLARPESRRQVVEAMTTNETYFFRDPAHYDAIRDVLLPRLKEERRDTKRLRFWSAAASTGQEAYKSCHASFGGRAARLEHSNPRYRLFPRRSSNAPGRPPTARLK